MTNRREFLRTSLGTSAAASLVATPFLKLATADVLDAPGRLSLSTGIPGMPPIEHPGLYTIAGRVKTRKTRVLKTISRSVARQQHSQYWYGESHSIEDILGTMRRLPRLRCWCLDLPNFGVSNTEPAWSKVYDGVMKINKTARDNSQVVFMTIQTIRRNDALEDMFELSPVLQFSNTLWQIRRDDVYRLHTVANRYAKPGDLTSFDLSFVDV